jgi:hypothetical protein
MSTNQFVSVVIIVGAEKREETFNKSTIYNITKDGDGMTVLHFSEKDGIGKTISEKYENFIYRLGTD